MVTSADLLRALINAHHDVVNAEAALAREDQSMYYNQAASKVEIAERRFNDALAAVRDRINELEGTSNHA